jgi:pimeloyl-ACP methyl ester carboxylesterase
MAYARRRMATFVLVHGAWRGSWLWKRVRPALQAAGHEVFTPTLTGVGERSHLLAPEVGLETHIGDVENLIRWEELTDVVLCGHSYAGCVVTGAADRLADRLRALVYLDAFVPEDGQSLLDLLPAEQRAQTVASAIDGWRVPPIPAAVFNVNADDREWVDAQCTVQPLASFEQPVSLSGQVDRLEHVVYVLATGFREGSPFPQFFERAKAKGWRTATVAAGHDVMLDAPGEVARILFEASESATVNLT